MLKKMENSLGKATDCFWIEFGKLKVFSVFTKLCKTHRRDASGMIKSVNIDFCL